MGGGTVTLRGKQSGLYCSDKGTFKCTTSIVTDAERFSVHCISGPCTRSTQEAEVVTPPRCSARGVRQGGANQEQQSTTNEDEAAEDELGDSASEHVRACKDRKDTKKCAYFKSKKFCTMSSPTSARDRYMKANCAKTCDLCSSTPSSKASEHVCKDTKKYIKHCAAWVIPNRQSKEMCTSRKYNRFMKVHCTKSCGLCSSTPSSNGNCYGWGFDFAHQHATGISKSIGCDRCDAFHNQSSTT